VSRVVSCVAVSEGESRPRANSLSVCSYSCECWKAVWGLVKES
jgi:hypothetical protein